MTGNFALGGRLEVRITPSDVGRRVSLRRVLEIVDGRPVLGDVVGDLTSWTNGVLVVTRRTGETVRVSEHALVAGKTVPGTPARGRGASSTSPAELQLIASRGWPPTETEPLGTWLLRAAAGFTRRANSALAAGDPGLPLDEALARVVDWYTARGLPPYLQVPTGPGLADDLAARGWTAEADTLVMTAPMPPVAAAGGPVERVELAREPGEEWRARYRRTGESADAVLLGGPSVWFAAVPDEEPGRPPAAIGRLVVDGRWAGFAAVEVAPGHRRRGLARAVMAALARQAYREGAGTAYLQVEADNAAALALYGSLGFTVHHGYQYRRFGG
ncbi:GNAT family N-acetyltransferase [Streptomyces capparidis]